MFLLFLFICIVFSNEINCFKLKENYEIDSNGIMSINKEGRMCDCKMNWYDEISINIKKIIGNRNNYLQLYINVRRFTKIEKVIKTHLLCI